MWTQEAREYFLNSGDNAFLDRYCSTSLCDALSGAASRVVSVADFRRVVDAIVELLPAGAHKTSGWGKQPLVVIGPVTASGRSVPRPGAARPRIGLCIEGDEMRLFADPEAIEAFDAAWVTSWVSWDGERICLPGMLTALDVLKPGRVHDFLSWTGERLAAGGEAPAIDATSRRALGHPVNLTCVYPRLVERVQPRTGNSSRGTSAVHPAPEPDPEPTRPPAQSEQGTGPGDVASTNPLPPSDLSKHQGVSAKQVIPLQAMIGAVYRDVHGTLKVKAPVTQHAFMCWFAVLPPGTELLSLVSGPAGKVATIAAALADIVDVEGAFRGVTSFHGLEPAAKAGDSYVYLYFRGCLPVWPSVFYVGMSAGRPTRIPRSEQHIHDMFQKHARGLPLTTKEATIRALMPTISAAAGVLINSHASYAAAARALSLRPSVHGSPSIPQLVRKALVFSGPDSRHRAFVVEYHLITSLYGAFNVDNKTRGNGVSGPFSIISRPKAFNVGDPDHVTWWLQACQEFAQKGQGLGRSRALLRIMALEAVVEQFDLDWLAPGKPLNGLIKPDPRMNRHMRKNLTHISVGPGAVATANYVVVGRIGTKGSTVAMKHPPFRIELRDRATVPAVRINLRQPVSGAPATQAFISDIRRRVGHFYAQNPISAPDDPFFKPFAPGANGKIDTDFEIAKPYPQAGSPVPTHCWPDWHPGCHGPPLTFDIARAIQAVLQHLLP